MILWMAFLHKLIMNPFLKVLIGAQYYTNKSLHENDQYVLIANHYSHVDTAAILSLLPWKKVALTHPVAAMDYFGKNWITSIFFKYTMNVVLINRKSADKQEAVNTMISTLDQGHNLIIFPEGSRSTTNDINDFKTGVVRVLKSRPNIVYIPILIKDSLMILPKGDPIVVPHNFKVIVGDSYKIDPQLNDDENLKIIRQHLIDLDR